MSNQDALTRLEKWLRARSTRQIDHLAHYTSGGFHVALRDVALPHGAVTADHPTLATAIHAALDRAEEQGL